MRSSPKLAILVIITVLTIFLWSCTLETKKEAMDGPDKQIVEEAQEESKEEQEITSEEQYEKFSIGYIGCSNTRQTVQGYDFLGGENIWAAEERRIHEYDGGAVLDWAKGAEKGNKYWKIFDQYLKENPDTKKVWWQLCIRKDEANMKYEDALPVIEALRKKIPNITIYVSPLAEYTENVCEITGIEGIKRGKSLAQELDSRNEDVITGPILGPLNLAEISNKEKDRCHPNDEGMKKMGAQMRQFFDGEYESLEEDVLEEMEKQEKNSYEDQVWRKRTEAALSSSECPEIPEQEFPDSYYKGPLIDTHLHIPAIPDWPPEEENSPEDKDPEGRFGGPQALLGWNVKISEIACTIKQEGTQKNFAFFPVYEGEISIRLLEIWNKTMHEHPGQFTPFIMSSGNDNEPNGFPTVDAEVLEEMLEAYPGLFDGYGEIGLYARENGGSPALPPDSERLKKIYPIVRKNNLVVYFHLGYGDKDNFERVLKENPDIDFIWHGDQLSVNEVSDILSKHPNAHYGIDEFFGGEREIFLMYVGESKEDYLETTDKKFDKIIKQALDHWKPLIEKHPDQVLWGTDRGDAVWNYDLEVGQRQVKIARAFIGKLNPEVQEKFAHKNAERLINMSGTN